MCQCAAVEDGVNGATVAVRRAAMTAKTAVTVAQNARSSVVVVVVVVAAGLGRRRLMTMTTKEHDNGQNSKQSRKTARDCSFAHLYFRPSKKTTAQPAPLR